MAGWRCRMSVHVPLFSSRAGCPGGKWLTGNGSWSTNGSWPIESWLALDRCTVQVVHVTALQCPGMLPETNLLTGAAHDTAPSYFPSFFIWRVVEPQVLLSPQMAAGSCVSPLAEQCPDLRAALLNTLWHTARVPYPSRDPAKVLMHPFAGHLSMPPLPLMNHTTQGKLFDIPSQRVVISMLAVFII